MANINNLSTSWENHSGLEVETFIKSQLSSQATKNTNQDAAIAAQEAKNAEQDAALASQATKNDEQDAAIAALRSKNTEQDAAIAAQTTKGNNHETALTALTNKNNEQDNAIASLVTKNNEQDEALAAQATKNAQLDSKNTEQDAAIAKKINGVKVDGQELSKDSYGKVNIVMPTVDSELSTESENAIKNNVVTGEINAIKSQLTSHATKNSSQDTAIAAQATKNTEQDAAIAAQATKNNEQDTAIAAQATKNNEQDVEINNIKSQLYPAIHNTEQSMAISPNILNIWGNVSSLTLTFIDGAQEKFNEYMLEFTVSSDEFTLTLPNGIRWVEEPDWESGNTYQISILNGLAIYAEWEAAEP